MVVAVVVVVEVVVVVVVVVLCQPTPREVDSLLVHATPREVNPGRAKSTHGHIV